MTDRVSGDRESSGFNEEWTAERVYRAMLLPYGSAGREPDELQRCPHCERTYYRSNAGACPRCGGPVPVESSRTVTIDYRLG
jgi:uncharacterized paraquat-inducible protein A